MAFLNVEVSKPQYKRDLIKQAEQDTDALSGRNKFFPLGNKCQPRAAKIWSLFPSSDRLQISAQTLL